MTRISYCLAIALVLFFAAPLGAQEFFYKGKTLTYIVTTEPGATPF